MPKAGMQWIGTCAKIMILTVVFSSPAWGANEICRVDLSCPTSGDGTTWECGANGPKKTVSECLAVANDGDAGMDADKIIIRPGTYMGLSNRLTLNDVDYNNLTVCGTTATGTDCDAAARDLIIIDTGEYHSNYASAAITFYVKYLTLRTTSAHYPSLTTQSVVRANYDRVRFRQTNSAIQTPAVALAQTGNYDHCLFEHTGLASPLVGSSFVATGGATTNLYWPMFGATGTSFPNYGVYSYTSGSNTNIYHAVIWNTRVAAIRQAAAGTMNIYNSVLGSTAFGYPLGVDYSSAIINIYSSLVIPYKEGTLKSGTGTVNFDAWSSTKYVADPMFATYPNAKGYIVISIDDSSLPETFVVGWGSLLKSKGMTGTWYLDMQAGTNGSNNSKVMNALATGGLEVGVHGYSHSVMTATTLGTLTGINGTNMLYKVDRANRQFAVKSDEGTWDYSFTWSATDPVEDTSAVLEACRIATGNNWNITYSSRVSANTPISSLADTGGWVAIGDMDLDIATSDCTAGVCSGYWYNEIYYPKTLATAYFGASGLNYMDARIGAAYEAKTFAAPYNPMNMASKEAVRTTDFLSSRSVNAPSDPQKINLYECHHFADGYFIESTPEATANTCRAMAIYAAMTGDSIFPMGHGGIPLTGPNSWETCLDAIKPFVDSGGVEVLAFDEWAEKIKNRPEYTYHHTGPDAGWAIRVPYGLIENWWLSQASPLINSGTFVPGVHDRSGCVDYAGIPILTLPDIGAYEDADDDNDGVLDADEKRIYGTNFTKADTDGDGVQDGTEMGYTITIIGHHTNIAIFRPDLDPGTKTNPLLHDTDGDGLSDGQEDTNFNGRVDSGETDPLNEDSDADGYSDGIEIAAGTNPLDPNSFPNPQPVPSLSFFGILLLAAILIGLPSFRVTSSIVNFSQKSHKSAKAHDDE